MRPTKFVMLLASVLVLAVSATPAGASRHVTQEPDPRGTRRATMRGTTNRCARAGHSLCIDAYDNPARRLCRPRRAVDRVQVRRGRIGERHHLPADPPRGTPDRPRQSGNGATWNFQLRPTFWFGLTLCDTESAPEFTKTCTPDSDANNLVNPDPTAPDYIGKHPGNAFMELQFYGPGYVPQFEGFGCTAHQYCAAMTIDSFNQDQNTGVVQHRRVRQLHPRWG